MPAYLLPKLGDKCSEYFRYRDLIECGQTFEVNPEIDNLPKQAESYEALSLLAREILDRVFIEFGAIRLTYGFASNELTKKIPARISPQHDQHSACEISRAGHLICERKGAAVDFIAYETDSKTVSDWIIQNCKFDRLYFYGAERPIHISVGPENSEHIIMFHPTVNAGRKIPRKIQKHKFLNI